ncbi:MAG: PKD domain-containing protein [Bacteroidetes bacterium]|nr:PKD domain-containing protein [Bacteroidota bacterium]
MKRFFLLMCALLLTGLYSVNAQISYGGTPASFEFSERGTIISTEVIQYPAPGVSHLAYEDSLAAVNGDPGYRVGVAIPVNLNPSNSGSWTTLPNGQRIWTLRLEVPGAQALGLNYSKFKIPSGGKLFVYNEAKTQVIGSFTEKNNPKGQEFATELIYDDVVILEYVAPFSFRKKGELISATPELPLINISNLAYIYRDAHPVIFEESVRIDESDAACEININCPDGANWQDEKRGIGRVLLKEGAGYYWCTGTLVNNVRQDFKPYFLLAYHCSAVASAADHNQWTFYFNYERAGCPNTGTASETQTVIGCVERAEGNINGGSDMALVELNTDPPAGYNVYWNGWERNTAPVPQSGVGIHHPAGDIKKISTFSSPVTSDTWWDGTNTGATNAHWNAIWVAGTTEGGSSGSPLFNQNHRVVGTLSGGSSSCSNLYGDNLYGKFSYHWQSNGGTAAAQVKPWLDPDNTNTMQLNGMDIYTGKPNFTASATTIYAGDSIDFTDLTANNPVSWSWHFDGAIPATSTTQNPQDIKYPSQGTYSVKLTATNDNGTFDEEKIGYITVLPGAPMAQVYCDDFSNASTWTLTHETGTTGDWVIGTTGPEGGYSIGPIASTTSANGFAKFDSDFLCTGNQIPNLTMASSADCSTLESVFLVFEQHYYRWYDSTFVFVSTNGSSWTKFPVNEAFANNGGPATNSDLQTIDISSVAAGQSTVWVRFQFYSPSSMGANAGCGYAWMIDDMCIQGYEAGHTLPAADFTASPRSILQGGTVDFTNLSQYATSYEWTFEGGTPSTSTDVSPTGIAYSAEGTFAVTLKAINANGFIEEVKTDYITVLYNCALVSNLQSDDQISYAIGHDATDHTMAIADKFTLNIPGKIKTLYYGVNQAYAANASNYVILKIWGESGGNPGAVLGQKQILISDMWEGYINIAEFAPISVGNTFFVGFEFPYNTPMDTVNFFLCDGGTGRVNTAYMQDNLGVWGSIEALYGVNSTFYFEPVLCPDVPGAAPVADFYADRTTISPGESVNFFDQSTQGTPTSWAWTLTGGSPSSSIAQNPTTVSYASAGSYDVSLTATNATGSGEKTLVGYISVVETLVRWDFPTSAADAVADGGIPANAAKTISVSGAASLAFSNLGVTSNCASASSWGTTAGKYWQVEFTTAGYSDVLVSSKQYSENRGPKEFKLQYKVGATGTWTDIAGTDLTMAINWTSAILTDVLLPDVCNNQSSVYLRWITTSTTGVGGNILAGRTNRIDDIIVTGTPCNVAAAAGTITGSATVCQGQENVTYSVPTIANAQYYEWTLPTGATIISGLYTNSITVDFSQSAASGTVSVYGVSGCGDGTASNLSVTVNPVPAAPGAISGLAIVDQGQTGVAYSVASVSGATSYSWILPAGASIASGTGTRNITVNFSGSAQSGNMYATASNACGAGIRSYGYYITVNEAAGPPDAAGTITGTATVCKGTSGVAYSVPSISGATDYVWTLPTGATIASGSNTNSITVDFSGSAISGTISVYGSNTYGDGTASNFSVTVNSTPAASGTITGTATVCAGTTGVTYSVTAISGATGYAWTLPSGASITAGNNTNSITVSFSGSATSGNVSVHGTNTCGSGTESANYAVTVNPLPSAAGTISGTATVCAGATGVSYSVGSITNATSYFWTVPSGATIVSGSTTNSITVDFSTSASSGNITVYGSNSCGNGTVSANYSVTVNPLPGAAGTITGTASVCVSTNGVSYSVPAVSGATGYVWTLPSGATIATGTNTRTITVNFSGSAVSGNISVHATNACGSGTESANFAVTVNPKPDAAGTITGTAIVCAGQTGVTYSVPAITNATSYSWSVPTGATITAGSTTSSITVSYGGSAVSGNITVYGVNSCGNGTVSANYAVTVNPLPAAAGTITGTSTVCSGQTGVTYSVPSITNATSYVWTVPAGATITSGSTTNSITVSFGSTSGNINVYGTNGCGNGTISANYAVTVNPLPAAAGTISGSTSMCQGTTGVAYTVGAIANATGYTWSLPTGATIVSGNNTNSITVNFSASASSGNVTVYGSNSCGNGTVSPALAITVNVKPTVDAGTNQTIPYGTSTTLNATVTGGTGSYNYSWTPVSALVSATVEDPTTNNLAATTVYTLTASDAVTSCSATDNVTVFVTGSALSLSATAAPTVICSGESTQLEALPINGTGSYNYSWTSNPAGFTSSIADPVASPSVTTTYIVNVSDGMTTESANAVVTVNTTPSASITGTNSVCSGNSTTLTGNGGTSYYWSTLESTQDITVTPGSTTAYTVTVTDNGCTDTEEVTVTVNPTPAADAGLSQTICYGSQATLSASGGGTYYWNTDETTQVIDVLPTTTTVYSVTVTLGSCTATDFVQVTVDPLPDAAGTITGTSTVCAGQTGVTYSVPSITNATSYFWSVPTGATITAGSTTSSITVSYGGSAVSGNITVSGANSCGNGTVSANYSVTVNPKPSAAGTITGTSTVCAGQTGVTFTVPAITNATSYIWTVPTGATITAGSTTNVITVSFGSTSGNINVYGANGCGNGTVSANYAVTVNPLPAAAGTITGSTSFCQGTNGVTYTVGAISNATGYTWSLPTGATIVGGNNTNSITVNFSASASSGNVTVYGSNSCGNGTVSPSLAITVNAKPTVDAGTNQTIPYGTSTTLNSTVTGGTGSYNYSWAPVSALVLATVEDPTTTALTATTGYTLTASDATTSCFASDNVTVYISGSALSVTATATPDIICSGESTQLEAVPSGGSGSYNYSWTSDPAGYTASSENPLASPTVTTTYIVSVDDGVSTETNSVVVTVNDPPSAIITGTSSICAGENTTLTSGGGATYYWSTNESTPDISVAPASTTSYTVTVSQNGCDDTEEVTVTVNPMPSADAGLNQTICSGEQATLTASGGGTYSWSTLEPTQTILVSPSATSIFTVTVSLGTCSATDTVEVVVNQTPVAEAGNNTTICTGNSAQLLATGGSTYYWSPSTGLSATDIANPLASPASTTMYYVTVSEGTCSAIDSVEVAVVGSVNANAGLPVDVCLGETVTLTATGGADYFWNTLEGTASIDVTPTATTTYSVTVSSGSCSDTDDVTVTVNPLPTATVDPTQNICVGGSTVLNASGGTSYYWSSGSTTNSANVSPAVTTTYYVTVTDNGCDVIDSILVVVNDYPVAFAGTDTSICSGNSIVLTATGGSGYSWSSGGNGAVETLTPIITATYTVTVSNNGCDATDDVMVTVNAVPEVDAGADQTGLAYGATATLSGSATGGSGNYDYAWSPGGLFANPNLQDLTTNALVDDTTIVTLTVLDFTTGCYGSDEVMLVVDAIPLSILVTVDLDSVCYGSSTQLHTNAADGSGSYSYTWTSDPTGFTGTTAEPNVSPLTSTTYYVTVNDGYATLTGSVSVTVLLVVADAGSPQWICEGETATLVATGGVSYLWSNFMTGNSIVVAPVASTTYTVTASIGNCSDDDAVSVYVDPIPAQPSISENADTLWATPGSGYQWYQAGLPISGANSQFYAPTATGDYQVIVTSANGCESDMSSIYHFVLIGITSSNQAFGWSVYPNPTKENVVLDIPSGYSSAITIRITNVIGVPVFEEQNVQANQNFVKVLHLDNLSEGVYNITISSTGLFATQTIVIQR